MPKPFRLLLLFLSGLVLAACGGGDGDVIEIRMLDNSFAPASVQIEAGDTVRFVNDGRVPHNAGAEDGSWSTEASSGSPVLQPGEQIEVTLDQSGTFPFFCSLHATQTEDGSREGMVGTLVVDDEAEAASAVVQTGDAPAEWSGQTRNVPGDYPTIQSAVDAAEPGDLVLVAPGVYKESVSVTTPGLVIRGTDRNAVILDGEFTRENGIAVTADGVAIENMTARSYTVNGFFWNGVIGYRGSYLSAIDDWVYGIYAFDSVDGLLEHSYASGSWDAGFYIGQCRPCNAVVTDVLAEFNGLGYSGTNASQNIYIVNSEWRHNVAGIVPNTLDSELLPPSTGVVVAGNYIHHNGERGRAPNRGNEWAFYGNGVALVGVRDSVVRNNLLVNNRTSGVAINPSMDKNIWLSGGNRVFDNVSMGSGRSDFALGGFVEQGSCFSGNEGETVTPFTLGFLHDCDGITITSPWNMAVASNVMGRLAEESYGLNPQLEHGDAPKPDGPLPGMPGGAEAEVRPAVDVFASLDFEPSSIATPTLPAGIDLAGRDPVWLGIVLNAGFWPVLMGVLLTIIPTLAWFTTSLWSLWRIWRNGEPSATVRTLWTVVVVALPLFGALFYLAAADPARHRLKRVGLVSGGFVVWVGAVVGAFVLAGLI